MKKALLLGLILVFTSSFAQMQGRGGMGRRGMGGGGNPQQAAMKIDVEKMSGIVYYDDKKIIKKLKIKDKEKQQLVKKYIYEYNKKMDEIKLKYHQQIKETKAYMEEKKREAMQNRDFEAMQRAKYRVKEKMAPVREETRMQKKILNEKMQQLLSKKQYKKWKKYVKKKNKVPSMQNNQNDMRKRGGMRGGMRGGGMF